MLNAVFLDRDGVLNAITVRDGVPYPPDSAADFVLLSGVVEACSSLRKAGFMLIVVTNQPDVARGTQTRAEVEAINQRVTDALPIQAVMTCYHDSADNCDCRKPKPGLILQAAQQWNIDLAASFIVGDRWSDIAAGQAAGCRTVFIS
ncbi:MAG: HAD family hydrolase, partial [Burkholderiales bacterium]|nr:HAD family hydrolase [Anaerolineae bacterium]